MSEKWRGLRNWIVLAAVLGLLTAGGLAMAQEGTSNDNQEAREDQGPPWLRPGYDDDWTPGTPGPPPWAGQDDDDNDGLGPPWLRPGYDDDWTPGTPGPPPWAGQDDD
jgi:hypothetical protein